MRDKTEGTKRERDFYRYRNRIKIFDRHVGESGTELSRIMTGEGVKDIEEH